MLGVVLCGGQSSRMGTDKGLINHAPGTWAGNTATKLQELAIPVVLSVNAAQYDDYRASFPVAELVQDDPSLSIKGPLLGVLSAHLHRPHEDLCVLACDMPLMENFLLTALLDHYAQNRHRDAFVYSIKGEPEPLCGIYTSHALAACMNRYREDRLTRHSMKFLLEQIDTMVIPLPVQHERYFTNVNTHAALNGF